MIWYFYLFPFKLKQFCVHRILDWQYEWHIFCSTLKFMFQFWQGTTIYDQGDWRKIILGFIRLDRSAFWQCFYSDWVFDKGSFTISWFDHVHFICLPIDSNGWTCWKTPFWQWLYLAYWWDYYLLISFRD